MATPYRQQIIDSVLQALQPGDDVVAMLNELLRDEKQPQLDSTERRDVLKAWQLLPQSRK